VTILVPPDQPGLLRLAAAGRLEAAFAPAPPPRLIPRPHPRCLEYARLLAGAIEKSPQWIDGPDILLRRCLTIAESCRPYIDSKLKDDPARLDQECDPVEVRRLLRHVAGLIEARILKKPPSESARV
jgi:hypothetical protein